MTSKASFNSEIYQNKISLELSHGKKAIHQIIAKSNQLQKDLKSLSRAEEVNIRSQQAKELQFRTKYEKYLTRGNFETSLITKDGFRRVLKENSQENLHSTQHVPLHKLIYTNGEVDVEKVLCLHLLSVQYIDNMILLEKKNFSLFKKRSKPNIIDASPLPFYILEIIHQVNMNLKPDFAVGEDLIVLVNNSIEKLVASILEVIAIVSPQKLRKIQDLSVNKKSIQEIMIKPKILNLLAQVKDSPVILKLENYRLEIAQYQMEPSISPHVLSIYKVTVKDKSKKIELMQTEINKRVARYCDEDNMDCESWSMDHRKDCNCRKTSRDTGNAIALLNDEGREFALVTGSGCKLSSASCVHSSSRPLSAIIKCSPKQDSQNIGNNYSSYSFKPRESLILKNDQNKLLSSLLHKVNNTHRLLIGKTMAEMKSSRVERKMGKNKIPINKIVEKVFSRESLISFVSKTENEEMKLLFQPCCKGGLGMGSFILEEDQIKPRRKQYPSFSQNNNENVIVPEIMKQAKSIMNAALIKQDIFTSETRNKIKLFLQSKNPGC